MVGREDPEWQQAVTAVVVLAPDAEVTPDELRRHCAEVGRDPAEVVQFTLRWQPSQTTRAA